MHVDWDWIFQRPHIFALKLEEKYDVVTAYNYRIFNRSNYKKNKLRPIKELKLFQVPKAYKFKLPRMFNTIINQYYKKKFKKQAFDYIWICHPKMLDFIPNDYEGILIYDCMDRHSEMTTNDYYKQLYLRNENCILKDADIIFASSSFLVKDLKKRSNEITNIHLVRNGFSEVSARNNLNKIKENSYVSKIGYIGTVASWFDFEILENSLLTTTNVEYHIIGPVEDEIMIDNEAIVFQGTVPHENLQNFVQQYDCLIMPFKVNEIILAVDPVKLYEYISYGKCIISVYYPEIERFSDYVYFYNNQSEYDLLISNLIKKDFKPKYSEKEQREFLEKNTWDERMSQILKLLEGYNNV